MSGIIKKKFADDIDYDILVDSEYNDDSAFITLENVSSEASAAQAGTQMESLQSAMDNYAAALNQSAIAKSTGLPVKTPTQQYKGFAAEEYFKQTMKINALAKGIPDRKIGIYTKGEMPDGSLLSGIDMETDISVWIRKHSWSQPERTIDYQSKIHNNPAAYSKDINNPQYQNVEFVGGSGQGVNDKIKVNIGKKTISSDSITPENAASLAEQMKKQSVPKYEKRQEKINELNKVNLNRAVAAGAATGLIITSVQEIIDIIKKRNDLPQDQFIKSVEHILCGTAEGGIRSGIIAESVQVCEKMVGKEIIANSAESIPIMAAANIATDFAKDLYKCFVEKTIDADDLLCHTVNSMFSSFAGFSGSWIGGQLAGQFSSQAFTQGLSLFTSAKTAAATGASIGSSFGPIGTVIGSIVGGIIIGIGANAIIGTAEKDAQKAFCDAINEISSNIELNGYEKLFYFADSMENISEFRLSFKDLLPCYNLISDLKEYNLHQKKLKEIAKQLETSLSSIEIEKNKALKEIENQHIERQKELTAVFKEQKSAMLEEFKDSMQTYITNSYMQYVESFEVISRDTNILVDELEQRKTTHSAILNYMNHRNEINSELNDILGELIDDEGSNKILLPFIDKLKRFMQKDELIVGRQYISFEEALCLVQGGKSL